MQHELSHDTAEDGFHEIQLSGKQLVFLFMTVTIVSVFIFLCGVLVGRGARDIRGLDAVDTTVAAAPAPQAGPADSSKASAEPPETAETQPAETKPEPYSYPDRLTGGTPTDNVKAQKQEPAPAVAAAAAPTPKPAAAPAGVPTSGRPGTHVVQVIASNNQTVAAALVRDLKAKGYPAFLVMPESPSVPQRYKVHVGRYNEREAEQVSSRLEREEKLKPWVISAR